MSNPTHGLLSVHRKDPKALENQKIITVMNCSGKINRCSPIRSKHVNTKNTTTLVEMGSTAVAGCCALILPNIPTSVHKTKKQNKMLKQNKIICAFCNHAQENKTTGAFCNHVCLMLHFKKLDRTTTLNILVKMSVTSNVCF